MNEREHIETLLAFIEDVKVCESCDTRNMNAVVYCPAHQGYLNRTTFQVRVKPATTVRQ